MSAGSDKILRLLERVRPDWEPPKPLGDAPLLDEGLQLALSRRLTSAQAQQSAKALRASHPDWNELRVTQVQDFRGEIKSKSDETALAAGRDVRSYLQEIFQKNHGFDIDFLRSEPEAGKFVAELVFLGGDAGHWLLHLAQPEILPVSPGIVRVLDRVGVGARTTSMKKARERLEPLVPRERYGEFARKIGLVATRWCDPRRPICWECPLVEDCAHGRKVFREWKAQQRRLEVQRKKEAARLEAARKKEEERRAREAARLAKKQEAERKKREREEERRRKKEEADRKKREERERKEAARKKAAAKKAAAKKTAKKAPAKKPTAKKPATRKKTGTGATAKRSTAKRPTTSKKPTTRKKASTGAKPAAKKKPATKKKTTKRPVTRKRPTTRKKA